MVQECVLVIELLMSDGKTPQASNQSNKHKRKSSSCWCIKPYALPSEGTLCGRPTHDTMPQVQFTLASNQQEKKMVQKALSFCGGLQMDALCNQECRPVGQAATVTSSQGGTIFELDHQTALLVVGCPCPCSRPCLCSRKTERKVYAFRRYNGSL